MDNFTGKRGTTLFQVWLTPDEKRILKSVSGNLNMNMSDFIRDYIHRLEIRLEIERNVDN